MAQARQVNDHLRSTALDYLLQADGVQQIHLEGVDPVEPRRLPNVGAGDGVTALH